MKPINGVIASLVAVGLTACALPPSARVTSAGGPDIATAQAEAYNGPKARIAVADFEDKMSDTGVYRAAYGRGLSDMLTTALFQTNRFIVLEREKLQFVLREQNLGASGRVRKKTAAPIGQIEGADLLVTAAITGFDPGVAGGSGSLGHVPGVVGSLLGAFSGSYRKAHVAMDLRVIDTRTARVLSATSVEGSATSFSADIGLSGVSMGGALGGFAKTPMEAAIREMIEKAVGVVAARTPQTYYRYSTTGKRVTK